MELDEEMQGMCGVGRQRAWSCIGVPDQHRHRGHYAGTYFNIRVLLQRCLHVIRRFLGPLHVHTPTLCEERKMPGGPQR